MSRRKLGRSFTRDFGQVPLSFDAATEINVFAHKNNKTLAETLTHRRYAKLSKSSVENYGEFLAEPLGAFLLSLKQSGDSYYKRFLNKYGDLEYSKFSIADTKFNDLKGVYAYFQSNQLMYIGRCRDSMKKRINQGYGEIHPKNCFLDGQATNCHLNARITTIRDQASLWLHILHSDDEIEKIEIALIGELCPPWNIQGK